MIRREGKVDGWGGDCSGRVSVCNGVDVVVRETLVPVEQSVVGYGHELEPVMSVELLLVRLHGGWSGDEDMRVYDAPPREVF